MSNFEFPVKKWSGLKKAVRLSRNLMVVILTIALAGLAFWEFRYLVFETSFFELKKVSIEGNSEVDKETIIGLSGFNLSQNFFKLDYVAAERNIRKHPKVRGVEIISEGLGEVLIRVSEREGVLLMLSKGIFYELDSEGYVLSTTNRNVRVDLPILTGIETSEAAIGASVKNDGRVANALNWVANMEQSYFTNISEVSLEGHEVILITNDGVKIYPGSAANFKYNFDLLSIVFDKFRKDGVQISYVDMRFNNEIVVKPIIN